MARRHKQGEAERWAAVGRPEGLALETAETLAPDDPRAADQPTVREGAARSRADGTLAFPSLDGDDERRMEDLLAARLFPRRAAPQRIGRYTIVDRIGQGGMGVVYAAYDPELDRRVAIKLLTETLAGQAEARLLREAQAMARVVHANVVSVIEVGVHEGRTFVVMEYVRGISLDRWRERAPHWRDTLRVYVQAGRGLAAAHRAGVIHRDFKPHNAMLIEGGVDDGRVKVLDFGLARATLSEAAAPAIVGEAPVGALAQRLTRTGALMGTPAYMAPEQLAGQPATERSDQFSFAVSLYEALYGQLPFAGESMAALTVSVLAGEVRPPPGAAQVPAWVHRVVVRGLAREPGDRFASMAEMCDALERDPSARRRAVGLALTLAATVGAGGWGLAQLTAEAAPTPCSGPAFELGEVWNAERAAAVEAAFVATGLPYAADTARRVRPRLDSYAQGWTAMRREACEVHQRGEQSAQLLDLRMACLDRRRAGFATLAGLFAGADAATVERAVEAALNLPALDACADVAGLTAETPPPDDPAAAGEVAAVRTRLAEIDAQVDAGRFAAAASDAEEVLARAEAVGFAPAIAEAALTLGTVHLEQGKGEDAERVLTIAAREGIEGRADRVAAEAVIRRLFVRGVILAQHERADGDDELAEAYADRFPRDGSLQWLVGINRGSVAHIRGEEDRARSLYQQALAVEVGPTPIELARTRVNFGQLVFDARDFAAARVSYQAAIEQAAAALGEQHPLVTQLKMYEGLALFELGKYGEARSRLEDVLARIVAAGIEETQHGLWTRIALARLDAGLGRYEAGLEHARRALAFASDPLGKLHAEAAVADAMVDAPMQVLARYEEILSRSSATWGADSMVTAGLLRWVGPGMLRIGRAREALPVARRWMAIGEAHERPDSATLALNRRFLADVLLALGETGEALTHARAAAATLAARTTVGPVDRALTQQTLGRALLAAGDVPAAIEALRAGVEVAAALDADAPERVSLQADLERALAGARSR